MLYVWTTSKSQHWDPLNREEVEERRANPPSLTGTRHPLHLAGWHSFITALSYPCHHKHRSPVLSGYRWRQLSLPCWVASTPGLCKVRYAVLQETKQFVPTSQLLTASDTSLPGEREHNIGTPRDYMAWEWSWWCQKSLSPDLSIPSPWEM